MNPLMSLGRREIRLVTSFTMLENWGLTPLDLGLESWDEVDPMWHGAMLALKGGLSAGLRNEHKRLVDSKGRKL